MRKSSSCSTTQLPQIGYRSGTLNREILPASLQRFLYYCGRVLPHLYICKHMVSASDSTPMQYPTMARITHCNQPRRNVREVKVILPFLVPISGAADGITEGSFH